MPIDWTLAVEAVPERGGPWTASATEAERKAVAKALELTTLGALAFNGRIERLAGGRYRLSGRVTADLEQPCVVTLDPVAARIDEAMTVEFQPDQPKPEPQDIEVALDEKSEIEPIVKGRLEIGRVVFETLSASLDPYPRKAGEAIDEMEAAPKGAEPIKANPFAVLADFKTKKT